MLSNPNLDAADTGVDPSTGRYLTKKERIGIFKRRKINASRVFGRKSPNLAKVGNIRGSLARFGAIVKTDNETVENDALGGVEPKDKLISGLMMQVQNNSKKIALLKNIGNGNITVRDILNKLNPKNALDDHKSEHQKKSKSGEIDIYERDTKTRNCKKTQKLGKSTYVKGTRRP